MSDASVDIQRTQELAAHWNAEEHWHTLTRVMIDLQRQVAGLKLELAQARAEAEKWRRLAAHREEDF